MKVLKEAQGKADKEKREADEALKVQKEAERKQELETLRLKEEQEAKELIEINNNLASQYIQNIVQEGQ